MQNDYGYRNVSRIEVIGESNCSVFMFKVYSEHFDSTNNFNVIENNNCIVEWYSVDSHRIWKEGWYIILIFAVAIPLLFGIVSGVDGYE